VHAHATTFHAQPSSIDDGIAYLRDTVNPALGDLKGFIGSSLLVDRSTGRCIATSTWESEEAMHASAEPARQLRDQAAKIFSGSADVEDWEVALLHRDHRAGEGACVRATWVRFGRDQIDPCIDVYKTSVLPELEELEGFRSASLLVDRASGRAVSSATFNSVEAMERNREQLDSLRSAGIEKAGGDMLDEANFELALPNLFPPTDNTDEKGIGGWRSGGL
jgi:heme-degrading monooxygenase HmoA